MARFLAPLVVLVALVGGPVVGQVLAEQTLVPDRSASPNPILVEQRGRDGIGVINDVVAGGRAKSRERAVLLEAASFLRQYNFSAASADKAQVIAAQLEELVVGREPAQTLLALEDQLEPLKGAPGERVEDGLPNGNAGAYFTVRDAAGRGAFDPNVLNYESIADLSKQPTPVGRYVPAASDRMLDTTTGTLYAVAGSQWQVVASLSPSGSATGVSTEERDAALRRELREELERIDRSLAEFEAIVRERPHDEGAKKVLEYFQQRKNSFNHFYDHTP